MDIVTRPWTDNRLKNTCFRGTPVERAGNFLFWGDCWQVFKDTFIQQELLQEVRDLAKDDIASLGTASLTITYPKKIGWASTERVERFLADDVEWFAPNKKSTALRVKACSTHIRAPATDKLTIVASFALRQEAKGEKDLLMIVQSIYPGPDIGPLDGNITERERIVFFDWKHPGEPVEATILPT